MRALPPGTRDNELQKLLKDRYNVALKVAQVRVEEHLNGRSSVDSIFEQAKHLLTSELELTDIPKEHVKVREKQLQLAQDMEKVAQARYDSGRLSIADYEQARYFRLDAEIQLLRAKQKAEAAKPK